MGWHKIATAIRYGRYMSIDNLVDYLSSMGRCGAHFSLHSHITNHSFECRRASKALELMEPHIRKHEFYNQPDSYVDEAFSEDTDGQVAWHFATYLIESINGGLHYGPDGVYLEVPKQIFNMLEGGFNWETREASETIAESDAVATYKRWLAKCLELRYDWNKTPWLDLSALYAAGLENDPPIDYENY